MFHCTRGNGILELITSGKRKVNIPLPDIKKRKKKEIVVLFQWYKFGSFNSSVKRKKRRLMTFILKENVPSKIQTKWKKRRGRRRKI